VLREVWSVLWVLVAGVLLWGLVLCGPIVCGTAQAASGELRTGAAVGVAGSTRLQASPLAGLSAGLGLSEQLEVSIDALAALPVSGEHFSLVLVQPTLAYKFDVLRWVPRVTVGAGYAGALGDTDAHGLSLGAGCGLNYLWDRSLELGLGYGVAVAPAALSTGQGGASDVLRSPSHLFRFTFDYRWGY
jgi:hypothetical protein